MIDIDIKLNCLVDLELYVFNFKLVSGVDLLNLLIIKKVCELAALVDNEDRIFFIRILANLRSSII